MAKIKNTKIENLTKILFYFSIVFITYSLQYLISPCLPLTKSWFLTLATRKCFPTCIPISWQSLKEHMGNSHSRLNTVSALLAKILFHATFLSATHDILSYYSTYSQTLSGRSLKCMVFNHQLSTTSFRQDETPATKKTRQVFFKDGPFLCFFY